MRFGERIKQLRLERNIGLREFCENVGVDPSNWSKIEHGFKNFNTKDSLLFHSITVNLQIPKDSELWDELFLLSYIDNVDKEKLFDENLLLKSLPFCLSIDGKKPTIEQYERLLELLENEIETMRKENTGKKVGMAQNDINPLYVGDLIVPNLGLSPISYFRTQKD